ncbi:DUF1653 domain-containing protein [Aliikangiella coralliicola]|uniref:DUF1653 domain-containing protein n=1 Tax=Aliikangiella coralliicola TaxID=2592383 RepID=A0A545UBN5_9GAMM|nr:DUF1653 domain-containing protein [Aliikangiella coralliicola]TQV86882.1 DUF1653 domain-containing protein [Aliikangiella coralliicola]
MSELDNRTIAPGKYRHYKGPEYEVIDTVYHSETEELMVLYRPLYGEPALWVRPFDMFSEQIEVNGRKLFRFEKIGD